jgi:glycine betaine/proline transport system permease protein
VAVLTDVPRSVEPPPASAGAARSYGVWIGLGVIAIAAVVATAVFGGDVPTWLDTHIQPWAKTTNRWIVDNRDNHWLFTRIFDPISAGIDHSVNAVGDVLNALRWPGVMALVGILGWRVGGVRAALSSIAALVGIGLLGMWDPAMTTLSLMLVAVTIALLIGIPLGIWTARSDAADRVLRVFLDAAQVMPTFVYLIPLVVMFGIQNPAAVLATVVYAVPPAVRLTNHGLRSVPQVTSEVGESFGCTPRQQLLKVQLPMARPTILLGLNQVIMMAFGIVVIAAIVGTTDLGRLVLNALQKNQIGKAAAPGLAIVLAAVALDRMSTGQRAAVRRRSRFTMPRLTWRQQTLAGAGIVAAAAIAAHLFGADTFPKGWEVSIEKSVDDAVNWVKDNLRNDVPIIGGTKAISDGLITHLLEPLRSRLVDLPWLVVVAGFSAIGYVLKGWRLAVLVAACLVGIASMGTVPGGTGGTTQMWDIAMDTLSLVLVSILISVIIALPLGILAGRSNRVDALLRPLLDFAQVMPQFIYLIPVVALFGSSRATGVVAAVVYSVPPCIRLTSLGLRSVPAAPREAATSFGATPRQELIKVQLPLAVKSILLGINQTMLMVLATVVIAALVGAGGLGLQTIYGLTKSLQQIGQGLGAGLSIVLLAIVLDRLTQAWGMRADAQREQSASGRSSK